MELTKEKYLSICEKNGFVGAKHQPELNKNNFYMLIETAPCFLNQLDAHVFSWFDDKCYYHFEWFRKAITTVEELWDEIERIKKLYERKCRKAKKEMIVTKKKEIQNCGTAYEC